MSDDDDGLLVKRALGGEMRAFERIVEKYQKTVFNVGLRMTHSYAEAEDITQSVFLRMFEKLNTFNPRFRFFSWLYRITINESLNALNRQKREERLDDDITAPGKTLEEMHEDVDTSERIQDALMDLKADHRAVIILKHFQGLSYNEISDILDISEKKVKSRLFTARAILKGVLVKRGVGTND
jgi:RNA polymerase sigma-70 factor (ECF subfamily)